MRFLGLDLGNKTLGIAVSNEGTSVVTPLENFEFLSRDFLTAAKHVVILCEKLFITTIALGNPIMMDGRESTRSKISLKFKKFLLSINPELEIVLIDERLTSVEAKEILKECGYSETKKKRVRDSLAAVLILESFLRKNIKNN